MHLQKINSIQSENMVLSAIPINRIAPSPYQARKKFDSISIHSLAQSIKTNGLLQPIVVRQTSFSSYELVAGERRLRACKMVQMQKINAIIINATDEQSAILCMVENVQRQDLHFFEIAEGYKKLIQVHRMTQENLAEELGIRQSTIANKIRVLRLSESIKEQIIKHQLTERHARALLRLPDDARQDVLNIIIAKNLNVKATDDFIHKFLLNSENQENETAKAKVRRLYSDWRLLNNSVKSLVEKMRECGNSIKYEVNDLGDKVQMTIIMDKSLSKK